MDQQYDEGVRKLHELLVSVERMGKVYSDRVAEGRPSESARVDFEVAARVLEVGAAVHTFLTIGKAVDELDYIGKQLSFIDGKLERV